MSKAMDLDDISAMSEADNEHYLPAQYFIAREQDPIYRQCLEQRQQIQQELARQADVSYIAHAPEPAPALEDEQAFCVCGFNCPCKRACEYAELALTSDGGRQQCACRGNQYRAAHLREYERQHELRQPVDAYVEPTYVFQEDSRPQKDSTNSGHSRNLQNYERSAYRKMPTRGRSDTTNSDLAYVPSRIERRRGDKDTMPLDFYGESSRYPNFRQTLPGQGTATAHSFSLPAVSPSASQTPTHLLQNASSAMLQAKGTGDQLLFGGTPSAPRPHMMPRYVSAGGNKRLSQRSELDIELPAAPLGGFEMSKYELYRALPLERTTPRSSLDKDNAHTSRGRAGSAAAVKQVLKRVFSRNSSSAQE